MKYSQLIEAVRVQHEINYYHNYYDSNLTRIKLATPGQTQWESDTLYVGLACAFQDTVKFANLVVCGVKNLKSSPVSFYKCNLIFIPEELALSDIFNFLNGLFVEDVDILKNINILLNSDVITGYNFKYLANMCSKILDSYLLVLDNSYKLIERAGDANDLKSTVWEEVVSKGEMSTNLILELSQHQELRRSVPGTPVQVRLKRNKQSDIVCRIGLPGHPGAGLVVCVGTYRTFGKKHTEILPVFSGIVAKRTTQGSLTINSRQSILFKMISESFIDHNDLSERMGAISFSVGNRLRVLVVDTNDCSHKDAGFVDINDFMSGLFPGSVSVYHEWKLVVLIDLDKLREPPQALERLRSFAGDNRLVIGCSDCFSGLIKCRRFYEQANISARLARYLYNEHGLFTYEDLRFYHLLEHFDCQDSLKDYCHASLAVLQEYDAANKTDCYTTLFHFIENAGNMSRTAEELFLHRNTLTYRIKKIEEITGLDLKDGNTLFKLQYSCKILRYLTKQKER